MTDVAPAADAETYSAEFVNDLKKQLEAKSKSEALLRAKFEVHDRNQRAQLTDLQPTMQEFVKSCMENATAEHKREMEPLMSFADSLDKAESVESAMPLARAIHCFSTGLKREREEFAVVKGSADELGKVNKRLEEVEAELSAKKTRNAELEGLCKQYQDANEKLVNELAKSGVLKEKLDFSIASAREGASAGSAVAEAAPSEPKVAAVDPLMAFISKTGAATGRVTASSTAHSLLGGGSEYGAIA